MTCFYNTEDVDDLFVTHSMRHHLFADDMQGFRSGDPSDISVIVTGVEDCVFDVNSWSAAKWLQLNATKTEILWFGSETNLCKLLLENRVISVSQSVIQPVTVVRDLGALIDGELSMCQHVSFICVNNSGVMSWRDSCLRSCYHVWTIVTPYFQCLHWRHYRGYFTLPLELSWTSDHTTMCLPPCETFTGCRSSRGSSSSCACSSTRHSLVIHQHT